MSENNTLRASVLKATYVGNHLEYTVGTVHGDWFVTTEQVHQVFDEGREVRVKFSDCGPVLVKQDV